MSDSKRRDFDTSTTSDKIPDELKKARHTKDPQELRKLYNKYPEETMKSFNKENAKRLRKIKAKAIKVAEKVMYKYQNDSRPLHEILNKMNRYKDANKWTDVEYEIFKTELENRLQGKRAYEIDYNQRNPEFRSRINKALGYTTTVTHEDGLKIKDSEQGTLSEILSMHEKSAPLHRSNFIDSLLYDDCGLQAISGEFNNGKHIASNHIHPLIVSMFAPKIGIFESQMLYSNIGDIVKCRYENKPIDTEANSMLFNDMITDPNDVVCDTTSPIVDLKKRYQVQIDLWEIVQKLRNGKYYDGNANHRFLTNLNMCKNNLYDNADLTYNQDEGSMLRRLMSVFSLRPTLLSTKPINAIESYMNNSLTMNMNALDKVNMQQSGLPFVNAPAVTITKIPMLAFQLPVKGLYGSGAIEEPINIQQAASSQLIWIKEGKGLVPREQTIIHSREVIIFYTNRRINRVSVKTLVNPIAFSPASPISFSNFEKINSHPVDIPDQIVLTSGGDPFDLRSVVAVTETSVKPCTTATANISSIVTGCVSLIKTLSSHPISQTGALCYDPFGASIPIQTSGGGYSLDKPFTSIHMYIPPSTPGAAQTFTEMASKKGTIFIYARPCSAGGSFRCEDFINV